MRNSIPGLDHWLTTPPDDNYNDFCPRCGANLNDEGIQVWSDDGGVEPEWSTDGFCSKECWVEYQKEPLYDDLDLPRYKRLSEERLSQLHHMYAEATKFIQGKRKLAWKEPPLTIDDVFDGAPDGDFTWNDTEAGDWHVYDCGEKDCPVGWHKVAYAADIGRENNERWIDLRQVDSDGNWDYDCGWRENEEHADKCLITVLGSLYLQHFEYFYGWFCYWHWAAQTGKDPLENCFKSNPTTLDFFNYAVENFKALTR